MSAQFLGTRLLGVLALAALPAVMAIGCSDDDKKTDNVDAGDGDGNGDGDGDGDKVDAGDGDGDDSEVDAGSDASVDEPLSCGEGDAKTTCDSVALGDIATLDACCTENAELVCGLDLTSLEVITKGAFTGCITRNQPSAPVDKKTSQFCTGFFENIDAPEPEGTEVNGFTLTVGQSTTLSFAGCCRLNSAGTGECGLAVDNILGVPVGFGCVALDDFKGAFENDTQFQQVKGAAVCDPLTGEAVAQGGDGDGDGPT